MDTDGSDAAHHPALRHPARHQRCRIVRREHIFDARPVATAARRW